MTIAKDQCDRWSFSGSCRLCRASRLPPRLEFRAHLLHLALEIGDLLLQRALLVRLVHLVGAGRIRGSIVAARRVIDVSRIRGIGVRIIGVSKCRNKEEVPVMTAKAEAVIEIKIAVKAAAEARPAKPGNAAWHDATRPARSAECRAASNAHSAGPSVKPSAAAKSAAAYSRATATVPLRKRTSRNQHDGCNSRNGQMPPHIHNDAPEAELGTADFRNSLHGLLAGPLRKLFFENSIV